jgi:two-component system, cell cycle sensor histidine kinase and response regulator CckA
MFIFVHLSAVGLKEKTVTEIDVVARPGSGVSTSVEAIVTANPRARGAAIDPANLRASLLALILRVSAWLGLVVYVPSVIVLAKQGSFGVVAIDTLALGMVFGLLRFDRVPFRFRASAVCLIYYALGVGLLISVGPVSQIYLLGFSVIAVLLFGVRLGLGAAVLSSASLLAVGALGHANPDMTIPKWGHGSTEWIVITINFSLVNTLLTLAVGTVLAAVKSALDREIAIRVSLAREHNVLRTLIATLPDVVFTMDTSGRFVNCNPAAVELLGMEREADVIGKTARDLISPERAAPQRADDLEVMAGRALMNREERSVDASGKSTWHLTTKVPLRDEAGETVGLIGVSRNVTDRKQIEAERNRLVAQLQLQIERLPLAYLLTDKDLRLTRWNPAAEQMFGYAEAEVLGQHPFDIIVPAESRAAVGQMFDRVRAGSMDAHGDSENRTQAGAALTCEWHNTPMFDDDGVFDGLLALGQDVTERRRLEGQLRQSQKMEAVGLLAGGIAHDFNNLLSVVLSYADLMTMELKADNPLLGDVEEIRRAGTRAADLTRQLLMFSRQQVVESKVLDLNEVMSGVDKMLRRVLRADIEFTSIPGGALGCVRADPGSIEQVIMNLVVNARDAMPIGGKLTVETSNVALDDEYARTHLGAKSGLYVMLSITDTGSGMDKPTLARIFEPFFTTKEKGKGTGLGLATVFGIVQQSGGTVWVYSEPGIGTTFKVYLPRVDDAADAPSARLVVATLRGDETILLVEDEDQVRDVARGILLRHGYTVLDARNGGEAFLLCEQHVGRIHLLLSDVVMPKMSGPALAKRLSVARPEMKVLCMSGYTDDAAVRHGVIDAELAYLQKPFTVDALTRKVRSVLDSS